MTNIDDKLRKLIDRYNALQQGEEHKNRLAYWKDYHYKSEIGPKGWRVETIDGTILPAIPDSGEVMDAFVNLAITATLALGKTYFSGVSYKNMCKRVLRSDGLPKNCPVKEGEQLIHCHLWETEVDFGVLSTHDSNFGLTGGFYGDWHLDASEFDPVCQRRNKKPIASVYLPRPKGKDRTLLPGFPLISKINQDGRVSGMLSCVQFFDGFPMTLNPRLYVTEDQFPGQVYIERLLPIDKYDIESEKLRNWKPNTP